MKKQKLVAYVIEPVDNKWDMVNQTKYMSDGSWVIGMCLITSLEDVVQRAWDNKIQIIPASCLREAK